ncbi:unnamed protein product [Phytophthora fragariaefolia]|uniref:Unnamed protein product n=1 Tax=Phytophthora fragariaefolia TaxID=1490495 RepID=A0A9W6WLN7_9STRA|nr:unnamed protein product [Phytophthora fragariaefolia]
MSLREYKKARGNTVLARDLLKALFDVGSDADMEDGEEDEEISSSRRDDPSVGSHHPREDDSDDSSSKRSHTAAIDRSLTLDRCPARGIQSRYGSTAPPSQYALYLCNGIIDHAATKELDFDPATDQDAIIMWRSALEAEGKHQGGCDDGTSRPGRRQTTDRCGPRRMFPEQRGRRCQRVMERPGHTLLQGHPT